MARFVPPAVRARRPHRDPWWRREPEVAESLAVAHLAGLVSELLKAPAEISQDGGDTVILGGRLFDPGDRRRSAPGRAASDLVIGAGREMVDYGKSRLRHPSRISKDVKDAARTAYTSLNPYASPDPHSLARSITHSFGAGMNQGRTAANLGVLAATEGLGQRPVAPMLRGARKYEALGFAPEDVAYLDSAYDRLGHHTPFPARAKYPAALATVPRLSGLAGRPLPKRFLDSPFNLVRQPTKGETYEMHGRLDRSYYGGVNLPSGRKWNKLEWGIEPYGKYDPQRYWHGTPMPLKRAVGAGVGAAAAGDLAYGYLNQPAPKK
jgi:hypothetical protein